MSEIQKRISSSAEALSITVDGLIDVFALRQNTFSFIEGQGGVRWEPDTADLNNDDSPIYPGDRVVLYGGVDYDGEDHSRYGEVYADVYEPLRDGRLHRQSPNAQPKPYRAREVRVNDGLITVQSYTAEKPVGEGPYAVMTHGENTRYKLTDIYDMRTGAFTVMTGEQPFGPMTTPHNYLRPMSLDELPGDIQRRRIEVVARSLDATASVFAGIIMQDPEIRLRAVINPIA